MIYIDKLGHLFSDVSIEELFEFATVKMRMLPSWNHYSKNLPHFDVTTHTMKLKAIRNGAVEVSIHEALILFQKVKEIYPDGAFPLYKSTGLLGQDIYRVNFTAYFIQKRLKGDSNGKISNDPT